MQRSQQFKEMTDEKFIEDHDKKHVVDDGMSDHERSILTRKILFKLDFRYTLSILPLLEAFSRLIEYSRTLESFLS